MRTTIKAKIISFHLLVLVAVLSAVGGLLYFSLNRIIYREVDEELLVKAQALTVFTTGDREDQREFQSSSEFAWEYGRPNAKSFYQIRRSNGFTLEKSPSLKDSELPSARRTDRAAFRTVLKNGIPLRLVDFPVSVRRESARDTSREFVIQCAEDIRSELGMLRRYGLVLIVSLITGMIISGIGGTLIARKALAPVRNISQTMDAISESNLKERIDVSSIPGELRVLASSFNHTVDRLEDAFRKQSQFIADASHEFRTPLSVVLSQSEIALRKERTAEEYRAALTEIKETAQKMSTTVGKLLELTRLRVGEKKLRMEALDLSIIINDALRLLRPLAERKEVHMRTLLPDTPPLVRGDRAALLELFTNLLDNAIKYNVPGGDVKTTVQKESGFVRCDIKDTGIGIPDGDLGKVFDRFYQVDQSRSSKTEGSGLGLSICKEIVDLHGGKIEIVSNKEEGTAVMLYLREAGA